MVLTADLLSLASMDRKQQCAPLFGPPTRQSIRTAPSFCFTSSTPSAGDQDEVMAEARHALTEAWDAVLGAGKPVKIESDILHGDAAQRLVGASRGARMLCVGHEGADDSAPDHRGTTASQVAKTPLAQRWSFRLERSHRPAVFSG